MFRNDHFSLIEYRTREYLGRIGDCLAADHWPSIRNLAESKEGLVLVVHTTAANAHDSRYLDACLRQVSLSAGSRAQRNEVLLDSRRLRSEIQRKAHRDKPLTSAAK